MPYRFVLEVPVEVHQDAKIAVEANRDAEILIERHPRLLDPAGSFTELTVVCHTLNVVDTLYEWASTDNLLPSVYLTAHKGPRVALDEHDAKAMRRLIQGDQYWYENTVYRISHQTDAVMEGGARVADVPYGGRLARTSELAPTESAVDLGGFDNVAINVRNIARAEAFYRDFFGMRLSYRALREGDTWRHLDAGYDYGAGIRSGEVPEIVRLENGAVSIVLINVGGGTVLHEPRVAYISLNVSTSTLNHLRGKALFQSFTVQEDNPRAFRFVDPFGIVWQTVATSGE